MSFSYRGDDPYVFVSFAREDRADVIDEIEHLHNLGYRVFFQEETDEAALRGAACVLIFVSPCTMDSDEVKAELQLSSQSGKDAVAIYLDDVEFEGTVGLLLGGVDDVKKFRMTEAFYRQQLDKLLGGHSRRSNVSPPPVVEQPAVARPAPARKASTARSSSGPGVVEQFRVLEPKLKAIYGAGAALALFIVFGFIYRVGGSGAEAPSATNQSGQVSGSEESTPELSKAERDAQQAKYDAERRTRREEREARAKERERKKAEREKAAKAREHFEAGSGKLAAGELKAAIKEFDEAISVVEDDPAYFMKRAQAKFRAKDDAGAIADYGKAIELEPESLQAYFERGNVLKYTAHDAAIADFTKVLELKKDHVDALIARGDARRKKGSKKDLKAAWVDYSSSIKIEPKYAAYYGRSLCKKKLGDERGADRDLEKARKLSR